MRSLPKSVAEVDDNFRWVIDSYLQLIEEIACDPGAFGTGGPTVEEVNERVHRAVELEDREAEDEAILGGMRVQTREEWQDFPELELLGDHLRRDADLPAPQTFPRMRRACGLPEKCLPTPQAGCCWPLCQARKGWTRSGSPRPFLRYWHTSGYANVPRAWWRR